MQSKNYRENVGIVLLNEDNLIFAGRRISMPDVWQMPQGGTDGNDYEAAMFRELEEETGLQKEHINLIAQMPDKTHYDFPDDIKAGLFNGEYDGQMQTWFCLKIKPNCHQYINLSKDLKPEFSEYKWVKKDFLMQDIVDFKFNTYLRVFEWLDSLNV